MKILVGIQPDEQGDDALACGESLARAMRADLVLTHVYPTPWQAHNDSAVDAEWNGYLVEQARATLNRSVGRLSRDVLHDISVHAHTSTGRGLIEVAEEVGASIIVIGSAPGGEHDHLAMGSTSGQLLHGASVPVLLVPTGYVYRRIPILPSRVTVKRPQDKSATSAEAGSTVSPYQFASQPPTVRPPRMPSPTSK